MGRKTSRSEDKLWAYVGAGDGMYCPLRTDCDFRKSGGWCADDNLEFVSIRYSLLVTPGDYEFIRFSGHCKMFKLVECLAQSYLQIGGISCPPVSTSLAMLADELDSIEVRLVPLKMNHGGLWRLEGKWVVQLNSNDNPTRRRYTLFHEVFHILAHLRTTPVFSKVGCEGGSFNESLADYFAACVLAPPHWVKKEWTKFKDIAQMAAHFDVPYVVMFVMLKRMGLI
ncbi:MAG: ImmA/IrrE family metallo-endopeptidase [Chloroflexi bacterium]|nr:ImmA/IrrE family metallo-endopeptidase [Chloroflexota bacterium]